MARQHPAGLPPGPPPPTWRPCRPRSRVWNLTASGGDPLQPPERIHVQDAEEPLQLTSRRPSHPTEGLGPPLTPPHRRHADDSRPHVKVTVTDRLGPRPARPSPVGSHAAHVQALLGDCVLCVSGSSLSFPVRRRKDRCPALEGVVCEMPCRVPGWLSRGWAPCPLSCTVQGG